MKNDDIKRLLLNYLTQITWLNFTEYVFFYKILVSL